MYNNVVYQFGGMRLEQKVIPAFSQQFTMEVTGVLCVGQDVTELNRARDSLQVVAELLVMDACCGLRNIDKQTCCPGHGRSKRHCRGHSECNCVLEPRHPSEMVRLLMPCRENLGTSRILWHTSRNAAKKAVCDAGLVEDLARFVETANAPIIGAAQQRQTILDACSFWRYICMLYQAKLHCLHAFRLTDLRSRHRVKPRAQIATDPGPGVEFTYSGTLCFQQTPGCSFSALHVSKVLAS